MKKMMCFLSAVFLLLHSVPTFASNAERAVEISASESFQNFIAENAMDEDINTRWALRKKTGWITLDFKKETPIDTVEILQLSDSIISLDILSSDDGENWNKIKTCEMESIANNNALYNTIIEFACVNTRYIKIAVTDAGTKSYINICELKAYYSGRTSREQKITDFDTVHLPGDILSSDKFSYIRTVLDLNIMDSLTENEFAPDRMLTRAELAYAAYMMRGGEFSVLCDIKDVTKEHKLYNAISTVINYGFMSVDSLGNFYPDAVCDLEMVAKVMVATLGYNDVAIQEGGYPYGYMQYANKCKIFNGITGTDVTRENAAVIFCNTLEANVMAEKFFNSDREEFYISDTKLVNAGMGLKKIFGQVKAVGDDSIDGGLSTDESKVLIDKIIYETNSINVRPYLGYNVECYCTNDDIPKIVAVKLKETNNVIRIFEEDLLTGTDVFSISYYKENSDRLTQLQLSRNIYAVYNGTPYSFEYSDLKADKLLNGYIDVIDINDDKQFDVIFIYQYEPYIVNSVATGTNKIYCRDGKVVDIDQYDKYSILKNGVNLSFEEIVKDDSISLFEDKDKKNLQIIVSNSAVKGNLTSIKDDVFCIDGTDYKISAQLKKAYDVGSNKKPKPGDDIIAFIDYRNRIFNIENDSSDNYENYAYMLGLAEPEVFKNGKIKLYTINNEFKVFDLADKVYINKIVRDSADVFTDPRFVNSNGVVVQLVKYSCNSSGEVRMLETAMKKSDKSVSINISTLTDAEKLVLNNRYAQESSLLDDETFTINANSTTGKVRGGNMSFDSLYFYDEDTVIFKVPTNQSDFNNENYFDVWNSDNMASKSTESYTFSTYDENDFGVAKVMVIHEGSANNAEPTATSFVLAVEEKYTIWDSKQQEGTEAVSGLVKGLKNELIPANDVIKTFFADIVPGDIVRYASDSNSRIYGIKKAFSLEYLFNDLNDDGKLNVSVASKPNDSFDYHTGSDNSEYEQICGIIEKVDDDRALIKTFSGGVEQQRVIVYRNSTVFTSYERNSRNVSVTPGTKGIVQPGCYIYARCEYGSLREVVVYNVE